MVRRQIRKTRENKSSKEKLTITTFPCSALEIEHLTVQFGHDQRRRRVAYRCGGERQCSRTQDRADSC